MYFPKRIPEPKEMGKIEMDVFEEESKKNYRRWMIPLVDDALEKSHLRKGRILDVGCGPGLLTKEFAERFKEFQVTGIDLSSHAVKLSKKNCEHMENTSFKVADASHIPFDDTFFDLVVCKDSLHHFSNLKKVIREMYRVLKPHGTLYLQDLRRDLPWYLLKMAVPPKNAFEKLQYYSARAAYTKKELTDIIKDLKLKNFRIKTRIITEEIKANYQNLGLDLKQLRASFQSRYVAIVKK